MKIQFHTPSEKIQRLFIIIAIALGFLSTGCFMINEKCPQDGEIIEHYSNGQISKIGKIRNCVWDGEVKNYWWNGRLSSIEHYNDGIKLGLFAYYNLDGFSYKRETYADSLIGFSLVDLTDSAVYSLSGNELRFEFRNLKRTVTFDRPTTLIGGHEPFIYIEKGNLHLNGRNDYYVVNGN